MHHTELCRPIGGEYESESNGAYSRKRSNEAPGGVRDHSITNRDSRQLQRPLPRRQVSLARCRPMLTPCRQVLIPARLWPKAPNRTQAPIPYLISCGGERAARSWCRCPQISLRAVTIGPELYKGWLSGRRRRGGPGGRRRSGPSEARAKTQGHQVDHQKILI